MKPIFQKSYNQVSNELNPNLVNVEGKYIYFIGIGGAGMSAIAKIMIDKGCVVSGSDLECSPTTNNLEKLGARINTNQNGSHLGPDTSLVITSAAIDEDNPDLVKARMLGLKVIKYSEFLGSLMKNRKGIAVSGTHGKTTTSAMISSVLKKTGYEPTFVIGGNIDEVGGGSYVGNGKIFVAEACEYDRTFLKLSPQIGVITNIEEDHLDYFKDIDGVINAFSEFVSLIPEDGLLIVNDDDVNIKKAIINARCRVEKFSVIMGPDRTQETPVDNSNSRVYSDSDTKWVAVVHSFTKKANYFSVYKEGKLFGDFLLKTPGIHNVSNALATISVCNYIGLNGNGIKDALMSFEGVNRRFQTISDKDGITIIDDYAHHPTEIKSTLNTAKAIYPSQRIWCVFQPHQHNRTKHHLKEFAKSLTLADKVIVTDIFAARDTDLDKSSVNIMDLVRELKAMGGDVKYIKNIPDIVDDLSTEIQKEDIIFTMGAGDIWKAAYGLKDKISK